LIKIAFPLYTLPAATGRTVVLVVVAAAKDGEATVVGVVVSATAGVVLLLHTAT
jgi:hypothetical protein